jgi:hypothetical protein
MNRKIAISMGLFLEKAQQSSFPCVTLGNAPVANTFVGNSQYFQEHHWKCSFLPFSMKLLLEKGHMEIL